MSYLFYVFLPLAGGLSEIFPSIRVNGLKEIAVYQPVVMSLVSIIGLIACVGLCKKILANDSKEPVGLFDFLRPIYLTVIIAAFPTFLGMIDDVMSTVTTAIDSSLDTKIDDQNEYLGLLYDKMAEFNESISNNSKRRKVAEDLAGPAKSDYTGMMGVGSFRQDLEYGRAMAETRAAREEIEEQLKATYKCSKKLGGGTLRGLGMLLIDKLTHIASEVFETMANLLLLILAFIGPFAFAFAMLPKFASGTWSFIGRYIQISFWKVCASIVLWANVQFKSQLNGAIAQACSDSLSSAQSIGSVNGYGLTLTVCNIATILMILEVPKIAAMIIESAGASGLGDSVSRLGTGAARDVVRDTVRDFNRRVGRSLRRKSK